MWLTLLLTFISAFADPVCTTIRLDGPGQAFAKIPPYDQNKNSSRGQDLCYAIVNAQLIDAYRFRHGDSLDQLTSPLSLALNHKTHQLGLTENDMAEYEGPDKDSGVLGPGNGPLALLTNDDQRVCDQRWLEKFAPFFAEDHEPTPDSSVHDFLESSMDQIQKVGEKDSALKSDESRLNDFYKCRVSAGATSARNVMLAARAVLKLKAPLPRMSVYLKRLCQGHDLQLKLPRPKYSLGYAGHVRSVLDSLLEKSTPTALIYCGEVLRGQHCSTPNHTSIVIGRECCGDHCRYRLRDSVKANEEVWLSEEQVDQSASRIYWLPD